MLPWGFDAGPTGEIFRLVDPAGCIALTYLKPLI